MKRTPLQRRLELEEILRWVESVGAQIWPTRTNGKIMSWTVQYFIPHPYGQMCGKTVVQPTRPTLRKAIDAAMKEGK